MAAIVLVPGFWLGAWAWERVVGPLAAAGHEVIPVTLPGRAERSGEDLTAIDLDTHIEAIVDLIRERDLHEVVLVGHSGGGIAAYGAADRIPERLAKIVFVDSGPLADGTSQFDTLGPDEQPLRRAEVAASGDVSVPPPAWDAAVDPQNLAGLTEEDLALLRERSTPEPWGVASRPLRLVNPARHDVPSHLVVSTFPLPVVEQMIAAGHPFFAEFTAAKTRTVRAVPTGHWPMFSKPAELAAALAEIAATDDRA